MIKQCLIFQKVLCLSETRQKNREFWSEIFLDCLRSLGLKPTSIKTEIFLNDNEREWAKKALTNQGLDPEKKNSTCYSVRILIFIYLNV